MERNTVTRRKCKWTAAEEDQLREEWGRISIGKIAERLGRSSDAVIVRARRLGLGAFLESSDYVTVNQLSFALNGRHGEAYQKISWMQNRGFPVHMKTVKDNRFRVVYLNEFWKWAEKHRAFLDFSKMEPLALGAEPEWVKEQRRNDHIKKQLMKTDAWTPEEDDRLRCLLKQHRYGLLEISGMMRRTAGAIQRRCTDLGLKERPVRSDAHSDPWTDEDFRILADGIRNGECYTAIGNRIGKSEKAIRGKVYNVYLTENADKVRAMLGGGSWGDGAPEPTVRQALSLSKTRAGVRRDLEALDALLRMRINQLGYDPYWQRSQCEHWDNIKGCAAGCEDCDSCTEFKRIRPQYCARCGGSFIERKENRFCPGCRAARKREGYRHFLRSQARA